MELKKSQIENKTQKRKMTHYKIINKYNKNSNQNNFGRKFLKQIIKEKQKQKMS